MAKPFLNLFCFVKIMSYYYKYVFSQQSQLKMQPTVFPELDTPQCFQPIKTKHTPIINSSLNPVLIFFSPKTFSSDFQSHNKTEQKTSVFLAL